MTRFRSIVERAWFAATDLVWPRACLVCDAGISEPSPRCLCSTCVEAIAADPHAACPRCSSTVGPHSDTTDGCPRCRTSTFHFAGVTRFGVYGDRLRDAILRAKLRGGDTLAELLGQVFAERRRNRLLAFAPQLVVPVPLHWRRWWERRHNQAEGVARGLAGVLNLPVAGGALRRVRDTVKQTSSTPAERRRNVADAFRPRTLSAVRGLRVLLVDDVLTTGATADAAAAALRTGGAAQVHVVVLAHR